MLGPYVRATVGLCALLVLAVAPPARAADRPKKEIPPLAVMPFEGLERPIGDAAYAAALKVLGTLEAAPSLRVFHFKQLNRVIEYHENEFATASPAERMRVIGAMLGARLILSGTMQISDQRTSINMTLTDVTTKKVTSQLVGGTTPIAAINAIPEQLAKLLGVPDLVADPSLIAPNTQSQEALYDYAACYEALIQQPIGIREPALLDAPTIAEGIRRCESAAKLDPNLKDARAALGLAYALRGDRAAAEKNLASVKGAKEFLPLYWLGKFWILSRYYGVDQAVELLRQVIKDHPGFLLARGYLGDALNTLGRHEEALVVFKEYSAAVPNQPWVMARVGYTLSKLKKNAEAIEETKKALRAAPGDSELLLEMSGRFIDAGRPKDAEVVLRRIVAAGFARGEVYLRLGYSHLLTGQYSLAERELRTAIERADRPSEWRTRGRARYDLAKLWMKQDAPDNAIRQLQMAVDTGYVDKSVFEADPDLASLKMDPRFKQLLESKNAPPTFISPFAVNPETGATALESTAKTAPAGEVPF